ncbi:MAG: hypothetical protein MUO50_02945 [Longimicrobiales bacterium]|nr:hypothetical protein [Longimicrobiales bacterium]
MSYARHLRPRQPDSGRRAGRVVRIGLVAAGALFLHPPSLLGQSAQENLPTIEVTYTQVLSSDSLFIGGSSLSADGRWIVFRAQSGGDANLWMVSSDGGEPFPLTSGPTYDDGALWFPGGDRIAYRSEDRIVSLAIDPETGRPVGGPKRVTLEGSLAYFDISPDGRWIAYTPMDEKKNRIIRVVPSNGGIARTVAEEGTSRPAWAPDGNSIYYVTNRVDSPLLYLMRVSLDGGVPDTVLSNPGPIRIGAYPNTSYLVFQYGNTPMTAPPSVATLDGRPLGLLNLPDGMYPNGFSKDGRTMLATRREIVSPLRVLSLDDGEPHTVTGSDSEPLGWAPDSNGLLFETSLDGRRAVLRTSVSGGAMAEVRFPERPAGFEVTDLRRVVPSNLVLSGDGQSLLYAVPGNAPDTTTLMVLDMETGRSRVVTERHPIAGAFMSGRVLGPGGSVNRDSDEFFFWEKEGEDLVLKAASPLGDTRVLRKFDDPKNSVSIAVFEDRLAFLEHADGEASILLASAGGGEPRRILTVDGFLDVLVWSPDGRWLAGTNWPKNGSDAKTMLVRFSEDGNVDGEPRFLGPDAGSWWGHQWLPDSSGFLSAGTDGDVWLMSVDPSAEPVSITDEEVGTISSFVLSPDGRTIAYAPRIYQGSSIWLLDLGDALVGGGSR